MRVVAAVLLAVLMAPTSARAGHGVFSGWFRAELVSDSIWWHCELFLVVDEGGRGTQRVSCRPEKGRPALQVEERMTEEEVARLRRLLREADLYRGQFWGTDLRGLDTAFITLMVNDESKAAVVVCYKNESFGKGSRRRLLDWLQERMNAKRQVWSSEEPRGRPRR